MTADLKETLEKVADRLGVAVEGLSELEKRMSKSAMDSVRFRGDSLSFMRQGSVVEGVVQRKGPRMSRMEQIPVEYKSHFKSATDFLQSMATSPQQFKENYSKSVQSLGLSEARAKSLGMNTINPESGGVAVLPEFAPDILTHTWVNDLWNRCDVYQVAGNSMLFPKSGRTSRADGSRGGGFRGYWAQEGNPATTSKGALETVQLRLHDLCVAVFVTQDLLDDNSYALEQFISRKVNEELAFQRGLAVMRGNGVNKPLGILNSPALIKVSPAGGQGVTVTAKNVVDMYSRRIGSNDSSTGNLVWLVNQNVEPQLHVMNIPVGSAGGQVVYMPPGGLSQQPYATLMGRPVIPSEFCSVLGTPGDIVLADFSQYLGIEKGGIIEETSTHVEFLSREKCFLFTIRMDGRPIDDSAITPYQTNGSDTQSAFVTLDTRS